MNVNESILQTYSNYLDSKISNKGGREGLEVGKAQFIWNECKHLDDQDNQGILKRNVLTKIVRAVFENEQVSNAEVIKFLIDNEIPALSGRSIKFHGLESNTDYSDVLGNISPERFEVCEKIRQILIKKP